MTAVRSFGTEDRAVPKHIPPRNETYEFIIFRGSDIKDLHVSEFPKQAEAPQDPAILSAVRRYNRSASCKLSPLYLSKLTYTFTLVFWSGSGVHCTV